MAGLLDLFGGGDQSNGGGLLGLFGGGDQSNGGGLLGLYGDALTDAQKQAIAQRGLLGFLGGMQKSGALDYTAPFLSGKVPAGFAAGLAGGAAGMGEAQDAAGLNALRGSLLGLQGQQLRANLDLMRQDADVSRHLYDPSAAIANPQGPSTAGPGAVSASGDTSGGNWETAHSNFAGLRIPGSTVGPNAGGFQAFASPEDGIGAISRQLDRYASGATTGQPLTTLRGIVSTWAPPNENDTAGLIKRASDVTGFAPEQQLDMSDPDTKAKVIEAMIRGEQGGKLPVAQDLIRKVAANPSAPAMAVGGGLLNATGGGGSITNSPGVSADNGQPFRPGLLASPAPASGLLAQSAAQTPPAASPAPAPAAAPSGGLLAGGAMAAPGGINPQAAQALAFLRTARGAAVPDFINKAAGLPFVGPTAATEAWAKVAPELYTKMNSPMELRSTAMGVIPATGQIFARNPAVPEGYTVGQDAKGNPIAEEVPGAIPGIAKSETAKETGKLAAEYGGIPGTALGSTSSASPSSQPAPTQRGTMLPPISEQFMPQSPGELKDAIPAWQKKTDEWNAGIAPARQAEMRLSTIAQAFKLTETGAFETHKAELAATLKGIGIDPSLVMHTKPDAVQEALHDNILTTLPLLKAATPRPSQIEFMSVSENREHPNLQPAANLRMLSEDIALVRQAQQLPADWNQAQQQGWRNPQSFETAWSQLNPLDKVREQVTKEIGPLKGMPGSSPPPDKAIRYLQFNPTTRDAFDAKYGDGAAAKVLGK